MAAPRVNFREYAVFIDSRGHAWVTAEHSNAVIEINLRLLPSGNTPSPLTLYSTSGSLIIHTFPKNWQTYILNVRL